MRMMLRVRLDTPMATQSLKSGRMRTVIESMVERLGPEAAYFTPQQGRRACVMVFDMQDSSQLPSIVEPFFEEFGAEVELQPVMTLDDLQKGLSALQ